MTSGGAVNALIGDGICDDSTNTEAHSWDDGDCCIDIAYKDTSLCQNCFCRLTVNKVELDNLMTQLDAKRLVNAKEHFDDMILLSSHIASGVETVDICSSLCMSDDLMEAVNGWSHDGINQVCRCVWLRDCLPGELVYTLEQEDMTDDDKVFVAYVQRAKLTSNDCIKTIKTTTTTEAPSDVAATTASHFNDSLITLENGKTVTLVKGQNSLHSAMQACFSLVDGDGNGSRLYEPATFEEMLLVSVESCKTSEGHCELWLGITDIFVEGE